MVSSQRSRLRSVSSRQIHLRLLLRCCLRWSNSTKPLIWSSLLHARSGLSRYTEIQLASAQPNFLRSRRNWPAHPTPRSQLSCRQRYIWPSSSSSLQNKKKATQTAVLRKLVFHPTSCFITSTQRVFQSVKETSCCSTSGHRKPKNWVRISTHLR